MKVNQAELIISAVDPAQYPQDFQPEIALAGRSNVGKSSLINRLIQRKNLARTSSQPGKTQTLNFYGINEAFRFVDLPGYGYAKVSQTEREKWAEMIDTYLRTRENLCLLLLVMDFRHPPSDLDQAMFDYAEDLDLPFAVVLSKTDKIKKSQHNKHIQQYIQELDLPSADALFPISSETGEGSEEIWQMIEDQLATYQANSNENEWLKWLESLKK